MFDLIRKAIIKKRSERVLEQGNDNGSTPVAACIVLLEAAHADEECSDEERAHVISTMRQVFSISTELAEELIALSHQERKEAIDLWQFTNHINQEFSHQEKMKVMEAVWRIIHADGHIDMHEDYFAHKLANLLRLTHSEMIAAKLNAKEGREKT